MSGGVPLHPPHGSWARALPSLGRSPPWGHAHGYSGVPPSGTCRPSSPGPSGRETNGGVLRARVWTDRSSRPLVSPVKGLTSWWTAHQRSPSPTSIYMSAR